MSTVSRGFKGRRRPSAELPPGQYLVEDFPVLSAGPTPSIDLEDWEFTITNETGERQRWDWAGFRALPNEPITVDIHCVTHWSKHGPGPELELLFRRCVGGTERTGRGGVGMTVDDLPLAVLAAIHVGDAQSNRLDWAAVNGEGEMFVAEGVGQVPAGAGGHQLEAVVGAVGEPRREPVEGLGRLLGSDDALLRPEHGHWLLG